MRRVVFLFAAVAAAQAPTPTIYELGTTPKPKAENYDAHGKAGELEIVAQFMAHSFSRGKEMYIAGDYLTVEVALYPAKNPSGEPKPFDANLGEFWLAVNHETTCMAGSPSSASHGVKNGHVGVSDRVRVALERILKIRFGFAPVSAKAESVKAAPMPPAPMRARIWCGPSLSPTARGILASR